MCSTWLTSAVSPSAASTAVMPSSRGMPAATSAPKASTRITSVTGTDVSSARWKSVLTRSLTAWLALASPTWPISSAGCARHRRGGRQGGVDAVDRGVRIAGDLEGQQRGAAVLAELPGVADLQRRLDRGHRGRALQARDEVVDGGLGLGPGERAAAA